MNITIAIIYVNGVARSRVEDDCLVECTVEGQDGGHGLETCRLRLIEAFTEIHGTNDVDVLFPELGECVQ